MLLVPFFTNGGKKAVKLWTVFKAKWRLAHTRGEGLASSVRDPRTMRWGFITFHKPSASRKLTHADLEVLLVEEVRRGGGPPSAAKGPSLSGTVHWSVLSQDLGGQSKG